MKSRVSSYKPSYRKSFLSIVVCLVLVSLMAFLAVGCAQNSAPSNNNTSQPAAQEDTKNGDSAQDGEQGTKTLVAYYSATGNTERIAKIIADATGGELYAIEPAQPYTSEELSSDGYYKDNRPYNESNDESARPALASKAIPNADSYNVVYLGYPIWYGVAPRVVFSFLDQNDFAYAAIYPFCTSGSSSITESENELEEFFPDLNWLPGGRFASSANNSEVEAWLASKE